MSTDAIEYRLSITGGPEAERVLRAVESAIQKTNKATTDSAAVTQRAAQATATSVDGLGRFGSAIGLAGGAIGRLNPLAGQMVGTLGQATGVIQSLATTGLGPLGIALGVATAAFGIITSVIAHFKTENEQTAHQIRTVLIPAIRDLNSLQSGIRSARSAAEQDALARTGQGSEELQQSHLSRQQDVLAAAQARSLAAQQAIENATDDYARRRAQSRLETARIEVAGMMTAVDTAARQHTEAWNREHPTLIGPPATAAQQAGIFGPPPTGRTGSGGGSSSGPSLADQVRANRGAAELAMMQDRVRLALEENQARQRATEHEIQVVHALQQQLAAKEAQAKLDTVAARVAEEEQRRLWHSFDKSNAGEGKLDSAKAKMDQIGEVAGSVGDAFANALGSSDGFGKALVASIDEYLLGLAKQETVKAIIETAEGFAALTSPFTAPLAAGHFQSAGLHAAAAALAGTASAVIPNAPASGGGSVDAGGGARPERSGRGVSGDGGVTVNINFGGAVVTAATEAELGRKIGTMVERGASRFGR